MALATGTAGHNAFKQDETKAQVHVLCCKTEDLLAGRRSGDSRQQSRAKSSEIDSWVHLLPGLHMPTPVL